MDYYSQIAQGYNELHQQEQSNKLLIIKNNIPTSKETKILDVGCGTGISSDFECFVVGIDPSIGLLMKNSKRRILGVAEALPFKNSTFDYVISVTSIHNFTDIKKSMDEIERVGKGYFVFSVLNKSKKFDAIKESIKKNFKIEKIIEEDKDAIFFCKTASEKAK